MGKSRNGRPRKCWLEWVREMNPIYIQRLVAPRERERDWTWLAHKRTWLSVRRTFKYSTTFVYTGQLRHLQARQWKNRNEWSLDTGRRRPLWTTLYCTYVVDEWIRVIKCSPQAECDVSNPVTQSQSLYKQNTWNMSDVKINISVLLVIFHWRFQWSERANHNSGKRR
jgi:hypothetical protein